MNEQQVARQASTFAQLQSQSIAALQTKLEAHRWWLEDYDEWSLDQDDGTLIIHTHARGESIVAHAPAKIIGTFNRPDGTWLWGWANPSLENALKTDAEQVRRLGEEKSFAELTDRKRPIDQQGAFGFAAIASHVCGSQGVFSAAAGDAVVYINFGQVALQRPAGATSTAAAAASSNRRIKILLAILVALFVLPIVGAIIAIAAGG